MKLVRMTAEQIAAAKGYVDRKKMRRTTEAEIRRQAKRDGTSTEHIDFKAALKSGKWRVVLPIDVPAIRAKMGLSQELFAKAFRISPHTLRNWEQGRRVPEGPARALLLAIDREPKALKRALGV